MTHHNAQRRGFTLVEILVVIAIISILAGIVVPATMRAINRANNTAKKLEVNALAGAMGNYYEQYGDYPPDGSNEDVLRSHMRKIFTRMTEPDLTLLNLLIDNSASTTTAGAFSAVAMDRGEALVFFLGGFSKDIQHPLTGPGGPLELMPTGTAGSVDLAEYQINTTRDNAFYDFKPERMTWERVGTRWVSNDETLFAYSPVDNFGGVNDLLPAYLADGDEASPIVYFDSRTYGLVNATDYNGYLSGNASVGGVRPYKTEAVVKSPSGADYATEAEAFAAIPFHNPDTFQIISPGSDGIFGAILDDDPSATLGLPIHFLTQSGRPVRPLSTATTPDGLVFTDSSLGGKGYQDKDWSNAIKVNGNLDNVTNFSDGAILEDDLQ